MDKAYGDLVRKKQLKILKHSWSAALTSQERQNGGSAEVKRQRCNNLLLFLPGQKKNKNNSNLRWTRLMGTLYYKSS